MKANNVIARSILSGTKRSGVESKEATKQSQSSGGDCFVGKNFLLAMTPVNAEVKP